MDICTDVACNSIVQTFTTTSTRGVLATPLAPRHVAFWRVTAVNGSFSTPSNTWEFFVGQRTAAHDTSWLGPPDFDRNGYTDVGLGSDASEAYIMLNLPPGGLPTTAPSLTLTGGYGFGGATANAGDVNGDGFGDFIVAADFSGAAALFLGNAGGVTDIPQVVTGATSSDRATVGGAGDVNGDGYADVVVGVGNFSYLYLGSATGLTTTVSGGALNGRAGAGAGDVNADGFADVVVCDRLANNATVYHGSPSGLVAGELISAPAGESSFGEACITAGDVNGDGYADIVVTSGGSASAFVFYGSATGVLQSGSSKLLGASGNGFDVRTAIASAGDVNGDGYADIIFGVYNGETVYVFQGGPTGISTTPTTTFTFGAGEYANSVAAAGDTNGDGYGDVVFAPSQCSGFSVFVYPGSAAGVTTTNPLRTWPTPAGSGCFGIIAR